MKIAIILFMAALIMCWITIFYYRQEAKDYKRLSDMYKDAYEKTYANFVITAKEYNTALEKWNKDIKARLKELEDRE